MSRATLTAAASHFFSRIFQPVTHKRFSELPNAEVLLGSYKRYTGGAIQRFGQSVTPEFMLQTSRAGVPVQNDSPNFGDSPLPADAPNQPLIWMRYAADPKVDDQATIQDLMGDLDTYAARKLNLGGVDVEIPDSMPSPANSQQWAQAIQANRGAIPDNLATITAVPEAFRSVAPSVDAFKTVLSHFFTYDANGAYYPRWSGAGRRMPDDLTPVYRQNNVRELKLGRDQMYVYLLVPKALFTAQNAQPHDYCEAVMRFEATGDPANPYQPTLIHSVYRRMPDGAAPFHDFVFFEAEDGVGLNVPLAARVKMSSQLTTFLLSIPDRAEDRAPFFRDSSYVIDGNPPLLSMSAYINGLVTMPAGVTAVAPESGGLLLLHGPIDKATDIALLPAVEHLDITGHPSNLALNLVRTAISYDGLRAKFPAAKQDGAGVIVGIIDSGIDGKHPSFKDAAGNSRILAYWDQSDGVAGNPNTPAAHNPGKAGYAGLNFGRERTGADCVNAADFGIGHGTHVSGIAAGSEVTAPAPVPRGIASKANLVVVSCIERPVSRPDLALRYIFQKASDLHMPCVVNMSFSHNYHPHDGTDDLSRALTRLLRNPVNEYQPGRVLVAAASNERLNPIHVRRNLVTGGSAIVRLAVNVRATADNPPLNNDIVTFWIRALTPGTTPNLRIAVQEPGSGWTSSAVTPNSAPHSVTVPGANVKVQFSAVVHNTFNGDFNVDISFVPTTGTAPLAVREWRLLITNPGPPVEINAWDGRLGAFPGALDADQDMKIGTPACAFDVISVAASTTRLTWNDMDNPTLTRNFGQPQLGDIASFSSPGPIRTCSSRMVSFFGMAIDTTYPAIDVTAPGSATQSALASIVPTSPTTPAGARNRTLMVNNLSWMMQGTSMAAPVITGLIACLLADEPTLTQTAARDRIRAASRLPDGAATIYKPGAPEANDWGPGLVNAPALKP